MAITILFYSASVIAVLSTAMVITRLNAVHALLYFIVSLLSTAVVFYILGAPFAAALEVIVYAGAIMVMFIFVVMMLNANDPEKEEKLLFTPGIWIGPSLLSFILLIQLLFVIISGFPAGGGNTDFPESAVEPKAVGISLFSTYLICVELAGILLMAGVIGAYHLGKERRKTLHRLLEGERE